MLVTFYLQYIMNIGNDRLFCTEDIDRVEEMYEDVTECFSGREVKYENTRYAKLFKSLWGQNYKEVFSEFTKEYSVLPRAVINSFTLFLWNDFVIVPISLLCAFVLFKKMIFSNAFKVIFFLPSIISVVILTLVFMFMFDSSFGIVNLMLEKIGLQRLIPWEGWFGSSKTAFLMILLYGLWSGLGYNIVLMTGAITRIPKEIFESAQIDGLSYFRELWYIVIPLIGSTLATLMLIGTTVIFTYFLQPLLLTGNNSASVGTYTIALYIVTHVKDNGNYTLGATIGIMCALIGTPIVVFTRRILDKLFPVYEY